MRFVILLSPKAQKRDRIASINGHAVSYKDKGQRQEEQKLMALMYAHKPPVPLHGPLLLGVKAYLPIPKSKPKKWQAAALSGAIRPTTKPDLDNLLKNIKDCLKGPFWHDDKQVVEYLPGTGKYYGDPARWEIEITALP